MISYGTIQHCAGGWAISCEPHVRARLKRVFARAPASAKDRLLISATPENSRDLLWFLERYPMELSAADADRMRRLSDNHLDAELRLADLLAARVPPLQVLLSKPAREYQAFAAQMLSIKGGLLLADDVGLGKTVTGIVPMANPENLPVVVVCPAHLPGHWVEKLAEFAPELRVHRIREGKPYDLIRAPKKRQTDLWPDRLPDVLVVSYHRLRGWAPTLSKIARYVVFDECQQLRNPDSKIYEACVVMARAAQLRMGLSATPIYNYGSEFFWVVDALLPDALGTRDEFIREWCSQGDNGKARITDSAEFGAYLRREGIMLRRTRAEVGRELPALTKIPHTIDTDRAVIDKAETAALALARVVLAHNERFAGEKMKASGELDALVRQATGVAKAPHVAEYVRMICDNGEKVVLFGWHREVYSIWLEQLKEFSPVMYTGSESDTQKAKAVADFVEGRSQVLIMSLRSGAGVDGLQHHCRTVIFGELDWSPGVHEQCIGRVHRDGQGDPVMAYFLIAEDGSDPIVSDVLGVKREQIEGVRNPTDAIAIAADNSGQHIKRLARSFLEKRGESATGAKPVLTVP